MHLLCNQVWRYMLDNSKIQNDDCRYVHLFLLLIRDAYSHSHSSKDIPINRPIDSYFLSTFVDSYTHAECTCVLVHVHTHWRIYLCHRNCQCSWSNILINFQSKASGSVTLKLVPSHKTSAGRKVEVTAYTVTLFWTFFADPNFCFVEDRIRNLHIKYFAIVIIPLNALTLCFACFQYKHYFNRIESLSNRSAWRTFLCKSLMVILF